MDKLEHYAIEAAIYSYPVFCFMFNRYAQRRYGHSFFTMTSFTMAMASCGIVWVALYYRLRHGDPDGIYKARVFWISVAALLYLSILVFNLYKTGWAMGLFGSLVQCSVYWILARYFYKPILLFFFLAPAVVAMWRFSGGRRTDTEIAYRTRNY